MYSREMKNDTPEQSRAEPSICRLPALLGAAPGWAGGPRGATTGAPQTPRAPGAGRQGRRGAEGPGPARPVHTQRPPQARTVALRVCSAANPQFPLPRGCPLDPGLTCPGAGRLGTSQTGAGRVGTPVLQLWLGGWSRGRPGVGRAIPEKVCRAALGEQRAGGGPGMFADLFVTQSHLPGVSKAELQASPGRERTWGRGRRGLVSVRPRWLGAAPRLQARAAVFH